MIDNCELMGNSCNKCKSYENEMQYFAQYFIETQVAMSESILFLRVGIKINQN